LLTAEIEGELYVADRRESELKLLRISGPEKNLFRLCEQPRTDAEIKRAFPQAETEWIAQFLQQLVELRLMLAWEEGTRPRYLALPVSVSEQAFYEKVLRPSLELAAVG
jgi:hypothetical protein